MNDDHIDERLLSWDDVRTSGDWASLLLGNGFSRNIWDRFGYVSLFDTAQSDAVNPKLVQEDIQLFQRLDTHNFEVVLSALRMGITVTEALGRDSKFLRDRYDSIRFALIAAVHHVHLPWLDFNDEKKATIVQSLSEFEFVYSTNSDLLTYWSIMHNTRNFKDYFWSEEFDIADTEIWGKCTRSSTFTGACIFTGARPAKL